MFKRVLDFLICPTCKTPFDAISFDSDSDSKEVINGLLFCKTRHYFPIVEGIPRLLPNSMAEHYDLLHKSIPNDVADMLGPTPIEFRGDTRDYDFRTKANFSSEWDHHDIGSKTWGMELSDRIRWFFLEPIRIPQDELDGMLMLDAGCGNGSQSVGYTDLGLEVVALDLSSGLEKGYEYRSQRGAAVKKVHFVQADLQNPPLRSGIFDIIHSAGVIHHTPNTKRTFRALRPLLKPGGTFYVWVYKYEKVVTPVVNALRSITTRLPPTVFSSIANAMALPFIGFCWTVDRLGIRSYEPIDRREAAIAVHDIFGAPYAHYHDFEEVAEWYHASGISEVWPCNEDRRGFGVCGRETS